MIDQRDDGVVHEGQIVTEPQNLIAERQGRAVVTRESEPIMPGQTKQVYFHAENASADVTGVLVASGAVVEEVRVVNRKFTRSDETPDVDALLRENRPRMPRNSHVFVKITNASSEVAVFAASLWLEREDRSAQAAPVGTGKQLTGGAASAAASAPARGSVASRTQKAIVRGATITTTVRPGRHKPAPNMPTSVKVASRAKNQAKPAQAQVFRRDGNGASGASAARLERHVAEMLLMFLERDCPIASGQVPLIRSRLAGLSDVFGADLARIEDAVQRRNPRMLEDRRDLGGKLRASLDAPTPPTEPETQPEDVASVAGGAQ